MEQLIATGSKNQLVDVQASAKGVLEIPQNTGTVVSAGTITVPPTIAAGGTYTSPVLVCSGLNHIAVSAQLDQTGQIVVQRYLDRAGSIAAGAALTQALVASTLAILDNNDGKLFQSMTVAIVNSGGVAATPSKILAVIANG